MSSDNTRSLREIVRILFSHWPMMALILGIGGAGTWFICEYVAPRKYRSQVSLIFKRPASKNPISTDVPGERVLEVFVRAQQQIAMSDLVLARAKAISEDPQLRERWYQLRRDWEAAQSEDSASGHRAQDGIREFLKTGEVAARVRALMERDQKDLGEFRKSVKLKTPGGEQVGMTETFTISVDRPAARGVPGSHRNAQYAADLVADMYIARYRELQLAQNDPAVRVMDEVVRNFNDEVELRKAAYDAFIRENLDDITGLEQLLKSGTEQGLQIILSEVRRNDATLGLELAKDEAIFDALRHVLPDKTFEPGFSAGLSDEAVGRVVDAVAAEFMKDDVGFVELTKSLASLETKRARIETEFLETSKDMQYIREQIGRVKRQMLAAIIAHARGLELRIASRKQQKIRNEELVRTFIADQNKVHAKLAQYARLKNDFEVAQKQLEKLQQDRIDAIATRYSAQEAVTINKLDDASTPDVNKPVVPLTAIYTAVACAVSLLMGVTLAFLADHYDHTLRSGADAERHLGVPVLASIKKRGRRLVVSA
jgi:uncharacterized protein involved in exopolysaccharide biosynthesis